jgi:MFS family permease
MGSFEKPVDSIEIEDVSKDSVPGGGPPEFILDEKDAIAARRLKWKIDLWCLPMITFIYFLAAMDRSDIGNAQVAGMQKAMHATDAQWTKVISLFYVGFVVGQGVGVYTLRSLTPQVVLGAAVTIWGLATTCIVRVTTPQQAQGLRVIIGFCEGIDHAALLYLSLWYTPKELATRSGIFYSSSSLAGAFNGLIAFAIVSDYAHKPPFEPWQWLLLIDGIISIGYGLIVIVFLPPVPERLRYGFTSKEKELAVVRTRQANNTPGAKIRWTEVLPAFKHPMLYVYTFLLIVTQVCLSGLSSFLPALVKTMGYTSVKAQLLTVLVYAVAFVTTTFYQLVGSSLCSIWGNLHGCGRNVPFGDDYHHLVSSQHTQLHSSSHRQRCHQHGCPVCRHRRCPSLQ